MENHVVDITMNNAQAMVIEESLKRPIVVCFWAEWCSACKSLLPVLEKLAVEYEGAFLLAKINADTEQQIAMQFGVQSLPTVMILKEGQPVDGFSGAKTEQEARSLLEQHLPAPWQKDLETARALLDEGSAESQSEAISLLRKAQQDSNGVSEVNILLASASISMNRLDEAKSLIESIPMVDQGVEYERVVAQLELAENAEKAPEIAALEEQHKASPEDIDVAFQLAVQYSQHQYHRDALELLYRFLLKDINAKEGELKRVYTDILAVLGMKDPLAVEFQRKIYALLY